ncbi:MAG: GrpB family protein [Puniceicoccales bacterium]|jgi:GrpB-like predicted nucleotidyltransferase (UPF0157 family)|nr:GrpB family protein [Puniceicoccales bacterium]
MEKSVKPIAVVDYDPRWPKIFEFEKGKIISALGADCAAIHHVGSTSVPGLTAKPKIDIIAVAGDRTRAIEKLEKLGYAHRGEWNIPLKCGFTWRNGHGVNLHLFFDEKHPEIELNLRFRDYLRSHPKICEKYAALKREILQDESAQGKVGKVALTAYTLRKRKFIDGILRKAGFDRLRVLKCWTEEEWEMAKKLMGKHPSIADLDSPDREHFILYRSVDTIGYAQIRILPHDAQLCFFKASEPDAVLFFRDVIEKWIQLHRENGNAKN